MKPPCSHCRHMPLLFLCILLLVSPHGLSQAVLSTGQQRLDKFDIFMDVAHQHDAVSVQRLAQQDWQPIHNNHLNLGFTPATVWIRFSLSNPSSHAVQRLLDVNYPLLDYVTLYQVFNSQQPQVIMRSGDRLPFTRRNLNHPNFISSLNLPAQQRHDYLLKISSDSPIQTELILWRTDAFQAHYRQHASILFFYLGLIFSSAAFNLLVFLYLRENVYLAYSLYAASFALFIASQHATLFEYVFPSAPELHHGSQLLLSNVALAFTACFNLLFLKIKTFSKSGWGLLICMLLPLFLLLASSAMSFTLAIQATVLTALIIIPTIFVIGVLNIRKNSDAGFFVAAWLCLFMGIVTFLTSKIGLIGFGPLINHSILIGSALELLIF
ncbi:MAG: 7TM-DISM domain-containing protein, partial [Bermanella sp.]